MSATEPRCSHDYCERDRMCPDCHPSTLAPPVPIEPASDDLETLCGQFYALQCLLVELTQLARQREFERDQAWGVIEGMWRGRELGAL